MKKTLFTLFIFSATCLLSCTKVIYTHQQVMQQFRTKSDIVNRFGLPSETRSGEGIVEWLYDYGSVSTRYNYGSSSTNASVYGSGNSIYGNSNTASNSVTRFSEYRRYVKFTLDEHGNVLKWNTNVDLTERKSAPGMTVLYLLLCAAAGVGLAMATSGGN